MAEASLVVRDLSGNLLAICLFLLPSHLPRSPARPPSPLQRWTWISPLGPQAATRPIPAWSVEAGGPAPQLTGKGGTVQVSSLTPSVSQPAHGAGLCSLGLSCHGCNSTATCNPRAQHGAGCPARGRSPQTRGHVAFSKASHAGRWHTENRSAAEKAVAGLVWEAAGSPAPLPLPAASRDSVNPSTPARPHAPGWPA